MAITITVEYVSQVTVTPTYTDGDVSPSNNTISVVGANTSGTYTASTSVPVSKYSSFTQAMTAGALTVNLAALPGRSSDEVVVGTGLKVQILKIINPSTNANKITVTKGGSNGYGLNAAGDSWTEVLDPGQSRTFELNESAPDIASGARTIDVSGTGTQSVTMMITMG